MAMVGNPHRGLGQAGGFSLQVPPYPALVKVVRDAVSACAAVADFAADEVDDCRLVADEAFYAMLVLGQGPISTTVEIGPGCLTVVMRTASAAGASWELDDLSLGRSVIDVLSAEHGYGITDGMVWIDLELRSSPAKPT